jgi:hypothetical protein
MNEQEIDYADSQEMWDAAHEQLTQEREMIDQNTEIHGEIGPLFAALSAAQAELGPAIKNSVNPHFKSKYADLADNLEAALPVLSKHGLSLVQLPGNKDGLITVTTILGHKDGAYIKGTFGMAPSRAGPHEVASCTTYLRRYSLSIYGAFADDDDGNKAQDKGGKDAPASVNIEAVKTKLKDSKDLEAQWGELTQDERKAIASNASTWWQGLKDSRAEKT